VTCNDFSLSRLFKLFEKSFWLNDSGVLLRSELLQTSERVTVRDWHSSFDINLDILLSLSTFDLQIKKKISK